MFSRFVLHESGDLVLKANNYEVGASSYEFEDPAKGAAKGALPKGAIAKVLQGWPLDIYLQRTAVVVFAVFFFFWLDDS